MEGEEAAGECGLIGHRQIIAESPLQLQASPACSSGAGSIGTPRGRSSKCSWQPIVRALPLAPTLPIRSAVRTWSPARSRGARSRSRHPVVPARVGAADDDEVAVQHGVVDDADDLPAAGGDDRRPARGEDVEALVAAPARARDAEGAARAAVGVAAADRVGVGAQVEAAHAARAPVGGAHADAVAPRGGDVAAAGEPVPAQVLLSTGTAAASCSRRTGTPVASRTTSTAGASGSGAASRKK